MRPTRTYSEMLLYPDIRSRFEYLRLDGRVGCATFGSSRWLNQAFYRSREWRDLRHHIIIRDGGCDLGVSGFDIFDRRDALIHHINPITEDQILRRDQALIDPENLITTTHDTHNAIHYGDERLLPREFIERREGDTFEWESITNQGTFPGLG